MTAVTASERRLCAVRDLVSQFTDANGQLLDTAERTAVAEAIRPLLALGRTGRWINAIGTWECLVLDEESGLHWALVQGSIFANHAA